MLARSAYSALLSLIEPLYLLRLWWRGRREPLYRHAIGERLGHYDGSASEGWLWVHAVSLGETRAAASLIATLRERLPGCRLLLTHGTATGREAGQALLHDGERQVWLPYDTPAVVQRFFAQFRPRVGVLMETEVWPNLLAAAQSAGVTMVLANARLSERSQRKGQRLDAVMRPAAQSLDLVLAQTDDDARRLREAGARDVRVCGNLKFDMTPDASLLARGRAWRSGWNRAVVLAAVTREGEEAPLLEAWAVLPGPRPLLVIVPRHPQRFDEVAALVRTRRLSLARRSDWGTGGPSSEAAAMDVWLGDSMREMPLYYALADVALLGGSFAPLGGQNLIEAAACGCPVVMGPHTFNFTEAAELSLAAGASLRVPDIAEGVRRAVELAGSSERADWSLRAQGFAAKNRGAALRMASLIAERLALSSGAGPLPSRD